MKRSNSALPRLVASLFVLSAAALTACASDDGTTDDAATGGATGTGGAGSGGVAGDGDAPSGGVAGDGDAADPNEMPSDTSQAGVEAFLAAGTYLSAPWVGDAAPRPAGQNGNVHGDSMRVFFNSAAVETKTRADGNQPAVLGSMIVKELYDAGVLVGHAVTLKTSASPGMASWTHYCTAPEGSQECSGNSETYPLYGQGLSECGFCHGEVPIAALPQ